MVIAYLPPGYRPSAVLSFPAVYNGNAATTLNVHPDGAVEAPIPMPYTSSHTPLGGVSFRP